MKKLKKITVLSILGAFISANAFAADTFDLAQVDVQLTLENNQRLMEEILLAETESTCLKLRDCQTDVQQDENIQTYFQDDIEIALQDIL